jgi:curved DNA-binding protein CbpA
MSALYEVLELRHDCSQQEVKAAYFRMARLLHPDKSKAHDAKLQFGSVNEAYQVLSDTDRRRAYDLSLNTPDARARAEAVSQSVSLEEDLEWDGESCHYTYQCRCGSGIVARLDALEGGESVFPCSQCSLTIKVEWSEDEEEEEEEEMPTRDRGQEGQVRVREKHEYIISLE